MPDSSAKPTAAGVPDSGTGITRSASTGMLAREPAAHLDPRLVDVAAGDGGVGAGQVDVLEDAALGGRLGEPVGAQAVLVDDDQLAGLDLADHAGADGGQGRVLGGDDPATGEPAEDQRPDALRVAGGVQAVLVHPDERERALELRQHLDRPLLQRGVGVVGQQRRDQAGVVGRGLALTQVEVELVLLLRQRLDRLLELVGVDQVAVVAERDGAAVAGAERRLGVLPRAGAGGGVAAVADRDVADQAGEGRLVEDLRDQAHVLVDQDLTAVADRDAGRLLAAVLQRVQPEVGQLGDVLARRPDPEHAAVVLGSLVVGIESRGQPAVASPASHWPCHRSAGGVRHGPQSRRWEAAGPIRRGRPATIPRPTKGSPVDRGILDQ